MINCSNYLEQKFIVSMQGQMIIMTELLFLEVLQLQEIMIII